MQRVLLAVFAARLAMGAAGKPDFSGTWKMDAARSESAHQDVPIGPVELVIRQTEAEVSIETRRTEIHSSVVSKELLTYAIGGKEMTNSEESEVPVKARAHWDGLQLVAETSREINGSTVTTRQVFQLGASGREISIQKTLTVQHGYQGLGPQTATGSGRDVFVKVR